MRKCDGCTVCCYLGAVPELKKPERRTCKHQSYSCLIYGKPERPKTCRDFKCSWLRGLGLDHDRPDKSQVMITVNEMNGGIWICVIELIEDALINEGKEIVLDIVSRLDLPAVVVDFDSPDDIGERVVIKKDILLKTDNFRGGYLGHLDRNVGIYELVTS